MAEFSYNEHLLLNSSEEKREAVKVALRAYYSIRGPLAYISMPITSGRRYYDVMDKYNVKTIDELNRKNKNILYSEIINPNIIAGTAFANEIRSKSKIPVIAPGIFEAEKQKWTKDEYMFLWLELIENRVAELHLMPGWEYARGCTLEFARTMKMKMNEIDPFNNLEGLEDGGKKMQRMLDTKAYLHSGMEITYDLGAILISNAIIDLKERGHNPSGLKDALDQLHGISYLSSDKDLEEGFIHGYGLTKLGKYERESMEYKVREAYRALSYNN